MKKLNTLKKLYDSGIIAIARVPDETSAIKSFDAFLSGGILTAELPFTVGYPHTILENLTKRFSDDMIIGAGTILDSESARIAILCGAQYIVTPNLNCDVIRLCNRYSIPVICGVTTPSEAVLALEAGVDTVKLFPATLFSPKIISEYKAPLPNLNIVPTGGISENNIKDWLLAGAFSCGVGGGLYKDFSNDYNNIKRNAKNICSIINEIR